ncbi:hypothetical protein EVAR_84708_1 [Eumeta japonica]|uniref:Uncharacterized protein n=1 Tax=Eumeta variegata TaxID=151549 RepID=A0A4C1VU68_EUMVA|nr:hypothetical protein EVAR_84708_1 [Eumeta japonica]
MKLVHSGISPRPLSPYYSSPTRLLSASSDSNVLFYSNFKLNANPRSLICEYEGRIPHTPPTPTAIYIYIIRNKVLAIIFSRACPKQVQQGGNSCRRWRRRGPGS